MSEKADMIGKRFGRLTIIKMLEDGDTNHCKFLCSCDCGGVTVASLANLKRGHTKSCGCLQKEMTSKANMRHGDANTSLWRRYKHMQWRCSNPNSPDYKNYGGRGIKVSREWDTYEKFKAWALLNGYRDDLTIDRIDVNGDYEPSNCRWITLEQQQSNRRDSVFIMFNGEQKTVSQWARIIGVNPNKIYYLKRKGISDDEIMRHFDIASILEAMKHD
jgi:hypothetical protein